MKEKKYRLGDIAEQLSISAQDILRFLIKNKIKVTSNASKIRMADLFLIYKEFVPKKAKFLEEEIKEEQKGDTLDKDIQEDVQDKNTGLLAKEKVKTVVAPETPKIRFKVIDQIDISTSKIYKTKFLKEKKKLRSDDIQPNVEKVSSKEEKRKPDQQKKTKKDIVTTNKDTQAKEKPEKKVPIKPNIVDKEGILKRDDAPKGLNVIGQMVISKKKPRKKSFKELAEDITKRNIEKQEGSASSTSSNRTVQSNRSKAEGEGINRPSGTHKRWNKKRRNIDQKKVDQNIRVTIHGELGSSAESRKKFRKLKKEERERRLEHELEEQNKEKKVIKVSEFITTSELAELIGVSAKDVIEACFKMGKLTTINQRHDREMLELLALEFGREVKFTEEKDDILTAGLEKNVPIIKKRPPVVAVMGHVDHGKTSLLDYVRKTNVIAGESGGITQHIGAYEVRLDTGDDVTFLDTPGHEVFTALRARGVEVTDIVILVIAVNDNVMPQTIEAISHAKAANVPIVVALNKIDLPGSNIEKIKAQLSEANVILEEWGGDVQSQQISAKTGEGVSNLFEKVLIQADLEKLESDYNEENFVSGVVIEAEVDRGKGAIATVLVQRGVLREGLPFVVGAISGKVRAMFNERGKRMKKAYPSQPVQIVGFESLPNSGDVLFSVQSEREAKEITRRRQIIKREQAIRLDHVRLEGISNEIKKGKIEELKLILKGDTSGSIEALSDKILKLQTSEIKVHITHKGVGQVNERDILLAAASKSIIIAFRVRATANVKKMAEKEGVEARYYSIIYQVIEDIQAALEGMLSPEMSEAIVGIAEVREIFKVPKMGNVCGCYVVDGKLNRGAKARLIRDGVQVYEGNLDSLRRFKDDVKEVDLGYECGLSLKNYTDVKVGDSIEVFEIIEIKRKLEFE